MGTVKRLTRVLAMTAALAATGMTAAPADAATVWPSHPSYTHNNRYSYSELRNAPGGMVIANLYNDSTVYMRCWMDSYWTYGNYSTNRWFYVTTTGGGSGWITASYVFNQATTPAC